MDGGLINVDDNSLVSAGQFPIWVGIINIACYGYCFERELLIDDNALMCIICGRP